MNKIINYKLNNYLYVSWLKKKYKVSHLILFLALIFSSCSNRIYKNQEWMIQIDLSDTEFIFDNKIINDRLLESDFLTFKLPQIHCPVENIDFQPEIRIYDKYLAYDTLDYQQISNTLYLYLQNRFEVIHSMMCPDEYGQLFGFVVEGENRYLYYYHIIDFEKKFFLIETISTLGTKREMDKNFKNIIKRIDPLKN